MIIDLINSNPWKALFCAIAFIILSVFAFTKKRKDFVDDIPNMELNTLLLHLVNEANRSEESRLLNEIRQRVNTFTDNLPNKGNLWKNYRTLQPVIFSLIMLNNKRKKRSFRSESLDLFSGEDSEIFILIKNFFGEIENLQELLQRKEALLSICDVRFFYVRNSSLFDDLVSQKLYGVIKKKIEDYFYEILLAHIESLEEEEFLRQTVDLDKDQIAFLQRFCEEKHLEDAIRVLSGQLVEN